MTKKLSTAAAKPAGAGAETAAPDPESPDPAEGTPERRIQLYDFYRQDTIDRGRLRILEPTLETLSHRIAGVLAAIIRQPVHVLISELRQAHFEEYASSQPETTFLSTAVVSPFDERLLLHLPVPLLLEFLDYYLGGDAVNKPERDQLTDIERVLLGPLVEEIWNALVVAFAATLELRVSMVQYATSLLLVQVGRPGEMCLIITLSVALNETQDSRFELCIPVSALSPILEHLEAQHNSSGLPIDSGESRRRLMLVPVELKATYPPIALTATELLNLRPGDVITVRDGLPEENVQVDLVTGDVVIGTGILIEQGNKIACSVVSRREDFS